MTPIPPVQDIRVAWLYPQTMSGANYIQPLLREFRKFFPNTCFFTSDWKGYAPGCEESFPVQEVGSHIFVGSHTVETGYGPGIHIVSPLIIKHLIRFKPDVIFVNGLGLWTLLIVALKPLKKWRIVQIYSGSSPNVDLANSKLRTGLRRLMAKHFDSAITNSQAGKKYLTNILGMSVNSVVARPYQMPDKQALKSAHFTDSTDLANLRKPSFLVVGQLIERKGITYLLKACSILESWGETDYSVIVVGKGKQRDEFIHLAKQLNLEDRFTWAGFVPYGNLGSLFEACDVLLFPTLEDIWGMVVPEAMLFGKPILCSNKAGAQELVDEGKNGFVFDPYNCDQLANLMKKFIDNPNLSRKMGTVSIEKIKGINPCISAKNLSGIVQKLI